MNETKTATSKTEKKKTDLSWRRIALLSLVDLKTLSREVEEAYEEFENYRREEAEC